MESLRKQFLQESIPEGECAGCGCSIFASQATVSIQENGQWKKYHWECYYT